MPRFDGTGPWGLGPRTGRGLGFCAPGTPERRPRRGRRGAGRVSVRGLGGVKGTRRQHPGNFANVGL